MSGASLGGQLAATPDLALAPRPAAAARDSKIQGLILAAGRGSRLGGAGQEVPKCLLEIGRRHLVEHQLDALADAGIGPTALVVGYASEEVREAVDIRAEYIPNKRWSQTNSLYSFNLAGPWIRGPVLILNSDVLFAPEILERLLDEPGDAIAIDSASGHSREQMAVEVTDGRVTDMRKDLPSDRIGGENLGILKLTAETAQALLGEAQRRVDAGEEKAWLGAAVRALAAERELRAVDMAGLPWVEIDFPTDLVRARKEVWPRIAAGSGGASRTRRRMLQLLVILLLAALPFAVQASLPTPAPPTWETVGLDPTLHEEVLLGEARARWWRLDAGRPMEFVAPGAGPLRIDARILDPSAEGDQCVLEFVRGDGEPEWVVVDETRPSSTWTHERWVVGKRHRTELDVAADGTPVRVRLVAPEDGQVLVRARFASHTTAD